MITYLINVIPSVMITYLVRLSGRFILQYKFLIIILLTIQIYYCATSHL